MLTELRHTEWFQQHLPDLLKTLLIAHITGWPLATEEVIMFYSKSTGGFYDHAIHGNNIPTDAVKISHEEYQYLLEGQALGKTIGSNSQGFPILKDPEPLSAEQMITSIIAAVQAHMDKKAKEYGYGDLQSAVTYADEPAVARFQEEGRAFRAWRSIVWDRCIQMLEDFKAGKIQVSGKAQVIEMLPVFPLDSTENKV